jgi:hypothetical protein
LWAPLGNVSVLLKEWSEKGTCLEPLVWDNTF